MNWLGLSAERTQLPLSHCSLVLQIWLLVSKSGVWQVPPEKPVPVQSHDESFPRPSTQRPPFAHEVGVQTLLSISQRAPLKPALQVHVKSPCVGKSVHAPPLHTLPTQALALF
jgi:hypothetical protein